MTKTQDILTDNAEKNGLKFEEEDGKKKALLPHVLSGSPVCEEILTDVLSAL